MTVFNMEQITIDEPITVGAVFRGTLVKLRWFIWKDRRYVVKETTFSWRSRQGEAVMAHFSVTDGSTLFELSLNQRTLAWRLEKICSQNC